jgi:hypothetical protein
MLIRLKDSGEVIDVAVGVAEDRIRNGRAELAAAAKVPEKAMVDPREQRATAPEQDTKPKKPKARSAR